MRELRVTPHVAKNDLRRRSTIDERASRYEGYAISQRRRKRVEDGSHNTSTAWRRQPDTQIRALHFCTAALRRLLFVSTAFAQFETSSALGSLLDPNGAATGNARVTITNFETGVEQKAVSDNSGACQFLEVRLGRYRLAAEAAGLKRAESAEFRVDAGARQRVDMRLEIGAVSQKSA